MKTLIILLLLIPAAGFAQSKKELRAEISKYLTLSASLESDLIVQTAVSDSLRIRTIGLEEQNSILEKSVKEYKNSATEYTEEISRLEEELDNCMAKGKPAPQTNPNGVPTKPGTDYKPFGNSGGHGSGGGNNFGNDDGLGNGDGIGEPGGGRYLTAKPNVSEIESEENCTIVFTVTINENGDIVGTPTVIKEKTTTTNTALIMKVTQVAKAQAKYNVVKGSKIVKKLLTIQINAN